jgi:hypothetical protein
VSGVASNRSSIRRLTDEECRILIAAEEHRLFLNKQGRYEIDQEERPDRRTRENLKKRGLLSFGYERITEKGAKALRAEITKRVEERR